MAGNGTYYEDKGAPVLEKHGYTLIKKVGEGSYGAAILARSSSDTTGEHKAIVKMVDVARASDREREDSLKESRVLASLKHPYIVRYRDSFCSEGWLCIVMDYCDGGDLCRRIREMRHENEKFPEDQVVRWFAQSCLALKYIHEQHILHRDVKSANFFISKAGNIKLGDFGIAKVLDKTASFAKTQIGTPYYLSPEICRGQPYSWSSDIWSMGVVLHEMCALRLPFDALDLRSLVNGIVQGPAPDLPEPFSEELRNIGRECLAADAGDRPKAAEILRRPLVQDMVRRMLEEVKAQPTSPNDQGSGAAHILFVYAVGEAVQYYSETHKAWLAAVVTETDANGRIMLNVKPTVWLSQEVQGTKVRKAELAAAEPTDSPEQ